MAHQHYKALLRKALSSLLESEDPLHELLKGALEEMAKIEAETRVGAEKHQRSEDRRTYFSGTRLRRLDTPQGTMYLVIPKLRKGGFVPFFLVPRRRSDAALMALVQEAYIQGVSTRRIDKLAKSLGVDYLSAAQVSEISRGLDDQVQAFRTRPLLPEYVVVWVDAIYQKVREVDRMGTTALMIVQGVTPSGTREILAVEPMYDESEDSWRAVFRSLKERGVERIHLLVSDAHKGIQGALRREWTTSTWQRCKVHFMRNILVKVPHRAKERFAAKLKQIWLQPDLAGARRMAAQLAEEYGDRLPEAINCLEEGLEDSLQFYHFPTIDPKKISSTNCLERTNRELRRRSRVVGTFPNRESFLRLIVSYLMEYVEDWPDDRSYIRPEKIATALENAHLSMEAH